MPQKERSETIENRWDILYRDYPEVYDEFAAVAKEPAINIEKSFDLNDKIVADIGSGSGKSTFALAKFAKEVIGVEIEDAMRRLAEEHADKQGIQNVRFIKGDARSIPLPDNSVEAVVGVTLAIDPVEGFRNFVKEATRITKPGGTIITYDVAPGWYGGELAAVIGHDENLDKLDKILVNELGFSHKDVSQNQEYGSMDKILGTYGFIFGKKAIEYLKKNNKTSIKWKFRYHYKKVDK